MLLRNEARRRFGFPRSVAPPLQTSARIFQFEQIKFLCPVSRAPTFIDPSLAYYREVKRRVSIQSAPPHLSSRQLASIRIADPVKSRDWGRTLEKPWVSRFCPAARGFSIIKVRFFPRFRAHGGKSEKVRNFISVCESRNARRTKIESIDFLIHYMTFLSLSPSLSLRCVLNVINFQICEIKLLRLYIRNKRWEYQ